MPRPALAPSHPIPPQRALGPGGPQNQRVGGYSPERREDRGDHGDLLDPGDESGEW